MSAERTWERLVGETCWHVSVGGVTVPSFLLVLGERIPRERPIENPRQPEEYRRFKGSVELLVWCSWRLETDDEVLASSVQGETCVGELRRLRGATVSIATCSRPAWDLTIRFTDNRHLVIFCDRMDSEARAAHNWELWTPGVEATAGPGTTFETATR